MHTPSSAARAAGVAKSTIYSAIKAGRLSAHKLQSGKYAIYLSELRRASPQPRRYPKLRNAVASASQCGMWAEVAAKVPPRFVGPVHLLDLYTPNGLRSAYCTLTLRVDCFDTC